MTESQIQTAILHYLQMLENMGKVYYIRNNSITGRIVRSNGSQGYFKNSKKGTPDIILLINGKFVGLEVKTEKGRQSPDQKIAQENIESCGGLYYIVRSVDDVKTIITSLINT